MSKRSREDWKHIKNMSWDDDEEFIDALEGTIDDESLGRQPIKRSAERPRARREGTSRFLEAD